MKKKILSGIIFILVTVTSAHLYAKPKKYCFAKQYNDACMLMPAQNLALLEEHLKLFPVKLFPETISLTDWQTKIPAEKWKTRREWLGINYNYWHTWNKTYHQANSEKTPEALILRGYFVSAVKYGPTFPDYYDANGRFFFTRNNPPESDGKFLHRNPNDPSDPKFYVNMQTLLQAVFTPFLFISSIAVYNQTDIWELSNDLGENPDISPTPTSIIPIGKDKKKKVEFFDQDQGEQKFMPKTEENKDKVNKQYDQALALADNAEKKQTPLWECKAYWTTDEENKPILGFAKMIRDTRLTHGFKYMISHGKETSEEHIFFPYLYGLYKLLLLNIGVDANNDPIIDGHRQQKLYDALQKLHNPTDPEEKKDHLWSDKYLSKDNFLQYKIAEILRKNPDLFAQAQQTVDFSLFKGWQAYRTFVSNTEYTEIKDGKKTGKIFPAKIFKDRKGKKPYKYKEVMKYIPGPYQALAYLITHKVQLLWYGTLSEEAFYEYSLPKTIPTYPNPTVWSYDDFVQKARAKNRNGISFIDTWQAIVAKIKQNPFYRKHWIGFDGHGWVVSFDKRLIDLQKEVMTRRSPLLSWDYLSGNRSRKFKVLDDLQCVGIDSLAEVTSFDQKE